MVVESEPHNIFIIICIKKKLRQKCHWMFAQFAGCMVHLICQDCMFMGQLALPLIQISQY